MTKTKLNLKPLHFLSQIGGRDVICLNLSGETLKVAYGKAYQTRRELLDLASYKIQGLPDEEIADAVRKAFEALKLTNPKVIVVVPAHLAVIKNIEIPSLDPNEIKEIVDLQAGRHTPFSRDEIIIDYVPIDTYRENYTKILLIIITLSVVRRQIDILAKAGMGTEEILFAPELFVGTCLEALKLKQEGQVQTVVHIDSNFSDFINVAKGKVIYVRSIPIGTHHLATEKERFEARFVEEIKKSIDSYQAEDIDKVSMEIILTGAGEGSMDLQNLLNNMIHTPVRRSFPYFKQIPAMSEVLKDLLENSAESFLDVAAPLLMPNTPKINLIPEEIKLRKSFEEKNRELVKFGVYVLSVVVLVFLMFANTVYFKSAYLRKLHKKYDPVVASAEHLENSFTQLQAVKRELKDRDLGLDALAEIYKLIPKNIQLTGIKFSRQGRFSLTGNSRNMSIVFSFIDAMEESSYFRSVEPRKTTKNKVGNEELVDFEITSVLEKAQGKGP